MIERSPATGGLELKKAHYIALAVVLVTTFVVLKLPARTATQIKLALGSLFVPLFGLSSSTHQIAEKAGNSIVPRRELLQQNEQLRRENAEMKVQLQRVAELERENDRLKLAMGFKHQAETRAKWTILPAHVIGRDPANWWRNVQIDLGRRDGLRTDLPVLTAEGLVGRVGEVGETRSRVLLLGDPGCRVSSLVLDDAKSTVDTGVITGGAAVLDESVVELNYLTRASAVKPGQAVVTSRLGGLFPQGIRIGEVVDTRPAEFGVITVARVKLAVKLSQLEVVWVMMP